MNYISPRLAAAAASTRPPDDVLNERVRKYSADAIGQIAALFQPGPAPQFGSIARVKHDERALFARVQSAINELELALGSAAEFSEAMPSNYSALLDALKCAVHDDCVTADALTSRLEELS